MLLLLSCEARATDSCLLLPFVDLSRACVLLSGVLGLYAFHTLDARSRELAPPHRRGVWVRVLEETAKKWSPCCTVV